MDGESTLQTRLEELKRLNRHRFDYVLAKSRLPSTEAALREIGLTKGWFYKFSEEERRDLDALADALHYEQEIQAYMILVNAVSRAASVKVDGLESKRENIRQETSSEILDRVLGKPTQRQEVTGAGGDVIRVTLKANDD